MKVQLKNTELIAYWKPRVLDVIKVWSAKHEHHKVAIDSQELADYFHASKADVETILQLLITDGSITEVT